jgi:hypothetical protein
MIFHHTPYTPYDDGWSDRERPADPEELDAIENRFIDAAIHAEHVDGGLGDDFEGDLERWEAS